MIRVCLKMGYIPPIHGMSTSEIMLKRLNDLGRFGKYPIFRQNHMAKCPRWMTNGAASQQVWTQQRFLHTQIESNKWLGSIFRNKTKFLPMSTQVSHPLWYQICDSSGVKHSYLPSGNQTWQWTIASLWMIFPFTSPRIGEIPLPSLITRGYIMVHLFLGIWGQQLPQTLAGWALHVLVWLGVVRIAGNLVENPIHDSYSPMIMNYMWFFGNDQIRWSPKKRWIMVNPTPTKPIARDLNISLGP